MQRLLVPVLRGRGLPADDPWASGEAQRALRDSAGVRQPLRQFPYPARLRAGQFPEPLATSATTWACNNGPTAPDWV